MLISFPGRPKGAALETLRCLLFLILCKSGHLKPLLPALASAFEVRYLFALGRERLNLRSGPCFLLDFAAKTVVENVDLLTEFQFFTSSAYLTLSYFGTG